MELTCNPVPFNLLVLQNWFELYRIKISWTIGDFPIDKDDVESFSPSCGAPSRLQMALGIIAAMWDVGDTIGMTYNADLVTIDAV